MLVDTKYSTIDVSYLVKWEGRRCMVAELQARGQKGTNEIRGAKEAKRTHTKVTHTKVTITKVELREQVLSDRTLTFGQKQQVLNFLAYAPGKGRGERAKDPIHKTSGLQIALNYLASIKGNRERVEETNGRAGKQKYTVGVKRKRDQGTKHTLTKLRRDMPHENTIVCDNNSQTNNSIEYRYNRPSLRSQVLELLSEKEHQHGLTLNNIALHFPDRTKHGLKSALNKAVSNGYLRYDLSSKVYYL